MGHEGGLNIRRHSDPAFSSVSVVRGGKESGLLYIVTKAVEVRYEAVMSDLYANKNHYSQWLKDLISIPSLTFLVICEIRCPLLEAPPRDINFIIKSFNCVFVPSLP